MKCHTTVIHQSYVGTLTMVGSLCMDYELGYEGPWSSILSASITYRNLFDEYLHDKVIKRYHLCADAAPVYSGKART